MTFSFRHGSRTLSAEILRFGPAIQVIAFEGEYYAALICAWMQSGSSSALVATWEIDGPAESVGFTGTNDDWPRYWKAFLSVMPAGLAEAVQAFEDTFRC